jgi:hypothetical protein
MNKLVEYIKLHLISLEQDLEGLSEQMEQFDEDSKDYRSMDEEYLYLSGQINATRHLMSVAKDIMGS